MTTPKRITTDEIRASVEAAAKAAQRTGKPARIAFDNRRIEITIGADLDADALAGQVSDLEDQWNRAH